VSNAAIARTVTDLLGGNNTAIFPGSGLDMFWTRNDSAGNWPRPVSELAKNDVVGGPDAQARNFEPTAADGDMQSMVTAQWHFIVHRKFGEQLYNWVDDPRETQNSIDTPEGRTVAGELGSEMKKQSAP
jgi:hypothetical protein